MTARLALVLLAPTLEAALPLAARAVAPARLHSARVIATLLVAFYVAFAPIGIDNYLYLPAVVALIVGDRCMSNRERWRVEWALPGRGADAGAEGSRDRSGYDRGRESAS